MDAIKFIVAKSRNNVINYIDDLCRIASSRVEGNQANTCFGGSWPLLDSWVKPTNLHIT